MIANDIMLFNHSTVLRRRMLHRLPIDVIRSHQRIKRIKKEDTTRRVHNTYKFTKKPIIITLYPTIKK